MEDGLTPEQQETGSSFFGTLYSTIEQTDTSTWEDGEIRAIIADEFAINKEKGFVFQKQGDGWKRIMNLLIDSSN